MTEIEIYYTRISDLYVKSLPKRIGAYVITHTPDNIHAEKYVGSTKNLYNRMYEHFNKEIICIDLYITDDIDLAESLERILMELIRPATNSVISPLSDKDNEIMKELLEDTNIKEQLSNNIIKIGYRYLKYINHNKRYLIKRTKRLNIKIEKSYLDVLNMIVISHKREIGEKYGRCTQSTAVQFIIYEFMKNNNLTYYIDMLENNK